MTDYRQRTRSIGKWGQSFQPDREAGKTQRGGTSGLTIPFLSQWRTVPLMLRKIHDPTENLLCVWCLLLAMSCLKNPKACPVTGFLC